MAESGGEGPADSYIGSLISLTSKSEIRYEGLLYTVDAENSNIALQNVRSFGTEGRKKNGPQIPASEKVYEFIIFRGTDIKDLQVIMSPPQPIHSDPAIISLQAQASQPPAVSSYVSTPVADLLGNQSTYKANTVPYYHTASSGMPLWAPPPPQVPSGSMPYYWQGFYRPQDEHRLLDPSSGQDSTPHSTRGLPASGAFTSQSISISSGQNQTSAQGLVMSSSTQASPSSTPASHVETVIPARVGVGGSTSVTNAKPYLSPSFSSPESSVILQERNDVDVPLLKQKITKGNLLNDISNSSSHGFSYRSSSPIVQASRKGPGKSQQVYKQVYRQVQPTKDNSNPGHRFALPKPRSNVAQPLLPLPISPSQRRPFFQESVLKSNAMRRGGGKAGSTGRSSRNSQPRLTVLEDFDFIAMNEKFNKEEVWDELLKVECKERVIEENGAIEGSEFGFEAKDVNKETDGVFSDMTKKTMYVKDDFFDSLSCDALDREHGRPERLKFSEQRRIDAETFGSHHVRSYRGGNAFRGRHGGAGGRGQSHGRGRTRGGYGYKGIRG